MTNILPENNAQKKSDEITLQELFHALGRVRQTLKTKRWFLWGWSALASILVILWLYFRKPIYLAKLTCVFKEDSQSSLMAGLSGLSSMLGGGLSPNSAGSPERFIDLGTSEQLQSKTLLQRVKVNGKKDLIINHFLKLHHYDKQWGTINKGPDTILRGVYYDLNTIYHSLSPAQRRGIELVRDKINKNLIISYNNKSGVIFIQFKDENQELASEFCSNLYQTLIEFYTYQATATLKRRVEILQNKVDSIQGALNAAQSASAITSDQGLGLMLQKDLIMQKRNDFLENTLTLMYGEALKNLEQLNFLLTTTTPSFTVIDYPFIPLKQESVNLSLYGFLTFFVGLVSLSVYIVLKFHLKTHFIIKKTKI